MSKFYLVTFHETDGNDCTVYDTIVQVKDCTWDEQSGKPCERCKDEAFGIVCDAIAKRLDEDGRAYSEDGSFGFYFDCDSDGPYACTDECDGHGGIVMRDAEGFRTEAEAEAEQKAAYYHSRFYIA